MSTIKKRKFIGGDGPYKWDTNTEERKIISELARKISSKRKKLRTQAEICAFASSCAGSLELEILHLEMSKGER